MIGTLIYWEGDEIMAIEVDEITLPAVWASALVNGDWSGLTGKEAARCCAEIGRLKAQGWSVVSTRDENSEPRFTWSYGLYDRASGMEGGEVLDYIIHRG